MYLLQFFKTCFFVYGVIYCLMGDQVNQLMQWQTDFYECMWGEKGRYGGLLCRGCTTVLDLLCKTLPLKCFYM